MTLRVLARDNPAGRRAPYLQQMPRATLRCLPILLGFWVLPCEITVEAERGDQETVVVCTILDHVPDWRAPLAALRALLQR